MREGVDRLRDRKRGDGGERLRRLEQHAREPDTAGLERALTRLLVEPALAARLGVAARETARLRFAPERSLAILEELYESLGVDGVERTPRVPESLRKAA